MAKAMEIIGQSENEAVRNLTQVMLVAAYERPRFNSQEFIDRAITDFESDMYLQCIKAM